MTKGSEASEGRRVPINEAGSGAAKNNLASPLSRPGEVVPSLNDGGDASFPARPPTRPPVIATIQDLEGDVSPVAQVAIVGDKAAGAATAEQDTTVTLSPGEPEATTRESATLERESKERTESEEITEMNSVIAYLYGDVTPAGLRSTNRTSQEYQTLLGLEQIPVDEDATVLDMGSGDARITAQNFGLQTDNFVQADLFPAHDGIQQANILQLPFEDETFKEVWASFVLRQVDRKLPETVVQRIIQAREQSGIRENVDSIIANMKTFFGLKAINELLRVTEENGRVRLASFDYDFRESASTRLLLTSIARGDLPGIRLNGTEVPEGTEPEGPAANIFLEKTEGYDQQVLDEFVADAYRRLVPLEISEELLHASSPDEANYRAQKLGFETTDIADLVNEAADDFGFQLPKYPAYIVDTGHNRVIMAKQGESGIHFRWQSTRDPQATNAGYDHVNNFIFSSEAGASHTYTLRHEVGHPYVHYLNPKLVQQVELLKEIFTKDLPVPQGFSFEDAVIAKVISEGAPEWRAQTTFPDDPETITERNWLLTGKRDGSPADLNTFDHDWLAKNFKRLQEGLNLYNTAIKFRNEVDKGQASANDMASFMWHDLPKIAEDMVSESSYIIGFYLFNTVANDLRDSGIPEAEVKKRIGELIKNPPQTIEELKNPAGSIKSLDPVLEQLKADDELAAEAPVVFDRADHAASQSESQPIPTYHAVEQMPNGSQHIVYKIMVDGVPRALKTSSNSVEEEYNLLTGIKHPHILPALEHRKVKVDTSALENGTNELAEVNAILLPFVPDTLHTKLPQLTEQQIGIILHQQLEAMEYLHSVRVFQHDIKLNNILINEDGSESYLTDFNMGIKLERWESAEYFERADYKRFMIMLQAIGNAKGIEIFSNIDDNDINTANLKSLKRFLLKFENPDAIVEEDDVEVEPTRKPQEIVIVPESARDDQWL